jgi:hypothetical protein
VEQLYVTVIPACWMNMRKMFLYHHYESDNLTCGEDLNFVEHAELKEVIFSIPVVVSFCMEIYILLLKTKAWTTVILTMSLVLL